MDIARLHHFANLVWRVYGFAIVMALLAIIPGCNFLYSGHGGLAWLVLPLVFPVVVVQLIRIFIASSVENRPAILQFSAFSLAAYFPLSFIASYIGAASIHFVFGLPIKHIFLWGFFIFPFGLVFNGGFFGL